MASQHRNPTDRLPCLAVEPEPRFPLPNWCHSDPPAALSDEEEIEVSRHPAEDEESARDERAVDLVFDAANDGERR